MFIFITLIFINLSDEVEAELNLTYHDSVESLVAVCDVVNISCPLHPKTEHLFNDDMINKMKRGAYIVNTARGKICDKDAIARALESGSIKWLRWRCLVSSTSSK